MLHFRKEIEVRWSDCDPNRHVRHSAYYDYGAYIRGRLFNEIGFSIREMERLQIGPILFKEECSFIRELRMDDTISINILKGDITENGSRFTLHHEIFNGKGEKAAHLTVRGAWMDLEARKLTIPPAGLATAFRDLADGEAFVYKKGI